MADLNTIPIIEVEVLPTVFVSGQGGGEGGVDLTSHLAATDPHPQYLTQPEGDSRYRQLGSIPASEITGTLADSQIPASIARDSEVTAAIAALTPGSIGAEPATPRTLTPTGTDPGNTATVSGFLSWLLQAVRGAQSTLGSLGALAFKATVSDGDIAPGAAIAISKLSTNPLSRSNHTGTQLASTISDFTAAVTTRLNSSSIDTLADVTSISPAVGQTLVWDGAGYTNATLSGSPTNLSLGTRTSSVLDILSDTGTDVTLPAATTGQAGLMTGADKTKLNGIATGATVNSTDVQLRDRVTHTGEQDISTITGLQTALDGKASLVALTNLRNEVGMIGTAYTNTSAANAAAVVVVPAPGAGLSLQLNQLIFGYNNDPTNGLLTVQQGATVIQSVPVTSKGTGPIVVGVKLATNTPLTITLSAGGAGVVGSINASVSVV